MVHVSLPAREGYGHLSDHVQVLRMKLLPDLLCYRTHATVAGFFQPLPGNTTSLAFLFFDVQMRAIV